MRFKTKKSLGQNFLIDKNIINHIVDLGRINNNDSILEVGPGSGNLTKKIIEKKPKKITLVEKDNNLSKMLIKKFGQNVQIINKDIMDIKEEKLTNEKMIIFGNLPYNISTQILSKWIKNNNLNSFSKIFILMFQKEVADRIIAKVNDRNYGRLSILSSWRMKVKKIKEISPNSFYPKPKVKSTILLIRPKKNYFKIKNPINLEYVTRIFFNQRRKMIKNPLKTIFKDNMSKISKKLKINKNLRPQNLSPLTYFKICNEYENLIN